MFNITGTLKVKFKEQQVSEKFKKREFVLTENSSQYPQHINFQLVQDKCGLIDNFNVGDQIRVFFNLRGREWTSPQGEVKYFNTIDAWKIEAVNAAPQMNQQAPAMNTVAAPEITTFSSEDSDDLPF
ncbi:MAG: hypothetical protein Fur0041_17020 [Bacteroidia bacterium]